MVMRVLMHLGIIPFEDQSCRAGVAFDILKDLQKADDPP
jgi:hypothetical protein